MTARDILIKARELITIGWCQHRSCCVQAGIACYCASGALYHASNYNAAIALELDARDELLRIIRPVGLLGAFTIVEWNDTTGRTKQEVVAAFDKAIDSLSEEPADAGNRT